MSIIDIQCADLLSQKVDAIVCPAHKHLIRGRGLSAQIFDRAGEPLEAECTKLPSCAVGEARLTLAHNLPARYIIHTVTPQWSSGDQWGVQALVLLRCCYQSALELALDQGLESIAFPALGAGTNRVPQCLSARIGLEVLEGHKREFRRLLVCLNNVSNQHEWEQAHAELLKRMAKQAQKERCTSETLSS
jgi:O-acetyl-ADP-ribose deacetylase (regulator of RNase III)